ncbi:hypothetical protein N7491_002392 [Penicillium cf. griseofulvum]|uniref:Uncharacterized protein n=1 Tax=Penicillium cf. griseofulvum TaxID=2972120 RepID=A0A9W9MTA4_9EURO|nr:hypothetical protein N7472_003425 [Penicillium cf. griseofulvum]KAJ5446310.1 hypothetical protein N7491_002392 [Penicillium cf. griseofulvum]KAJ5448053.1 hypothetical protein N7445_002874 [Penicillium cf. griseofulvum]
MCRYKTIENYVLLVKSIIDTKILRRPRGRPLLSIDDRVNDPEDGDLFTQQWDASMLDFHILY